MTIAANGNGLISSKLTTYEKPPEWAKYPDFFPSDQAFIQEMDSYQPTPPTPPTPTPTPVPTPAPTPTHTSPAYASPAHTATFSAVAAFTTKALTASASKTTALTVKIFHAFICYWLKFILKQLFGEQITFLKLFRSFESGKVNTFFRVIAYCAIFKKTPKSSFIFLTVYSPNDRT